MNPNIYVLLMGQRENKEAKKYGGKNSMAKNSEAKNQKEMGQKTPPQAKKTVLTVFVIMFCSIVCNSYGIVAEISNPTSATWSNLFVLTDIFTCPD